MFWEEIIDGCLVKFQYHSYTAEYFFVVYLDNDEIFDSNDQGGTEDKEWARKWAAGIIRDYVFELD
jgi:hypothetical protein